MANTRQSIIDTIDTQLKTILTANGYDTDLGSNVFEWRQVPLQASELPALIYRDAMSETEIIVLDKHTHKLTLEVEVKTEPGAIDGTLARKMIADVVKAIGVDHTWGALAIKTDPLNSEIIFDEGGKEKIISGAIINFEIMYRTDLWRI